MRQRLGNVTVDIPEGWSDDTVYRFASPIDSDLNVPLAHARPGQVGLLRATFGMTRLALETAMTTAEVAAVQLTGFRSLPSFRLEAEAPWEHAALGPQAAVEISYEVAPGARVRQALVYVALPKGGVCCLTFSAATEAFPSHRGRFEEICKSLEF